MAKLCNTCRAKIRRKRAKNSAIKAAKRAKEFAQMKRRFKKALASETLIIWAPPGIGKSFKEVNHA